MSDPPPRVAWQSNFPDVVIHTTVKRRDAHPGYAEAKAGDPSAALALSLALVSADAVADLKRLVRGKRTRLIPVVADETHGFNAIPDALAQVLARKLGLKAERGGIVQSNKVGHTRAPSFQRMVTPAEFLGPVRRGSNYLLVDDHVGLGGTLANLRGYIEARGGKIVGMTTLTESRDARTICLQEATRAMLWKKHGKALDTLWEAEFGYGIDCLTDIEAQNLCRQRSVAAIEDFLAQAAVEARGRGLEPSVG